MSIAALRPALSLCACLCLAWLSLWTGCKKITLLKDPEALLAFEVDTLTFDTVFTNMGSATRSFKVYNPYNQPVLISRIELAGGMHSDFRLNIDGQALPGLQDVELRAKDSMYIFAIVRIDPNNGDMLREDSVLFELNGNRQKVVLNAYGWNANYYSCRRCITRYTDSQVTMTADKPNVVMGWVVIDSNSTLTIAPNAEVFMFGGPSSSPLDRALIYIGDNSSIKSNVGGNLSNAVQIKTHRLEQDYQLIPLHHNGIYLSSGSRDNQIHGTVIRNAIDGVFVDSLSLNANPKLEIKNSMIYNVERSGILARQSDIKAENLVLASSNQFLFVGLRGGNYRFDHSTLINLAENPLVGRKEVALSLRDFEVTYDDLGNEIVLVADGSSIFNNCIIYGNKKEEVEAVAVTGSTAVFDFSFNQCLMKIDTFSRGLNNCIFNLNPLLKTLNSEDGRDYYNIDTSVSPVIDVGALLPGISTDMQGNPRVVGTAPDLGAYEWQQ